MNRRNFTKTMSLAAIAFLLLLSTPNLANAANAIMFKDPGCACCTAWAEHLRHHGFTVKEKKMDNMEAVKSFYGVPAKLASCHTAIIDGYVIEGHVPADDVLRLLKERPAVAGLTAPGMPQKSPGMQQPGLEPKGYEVLSFDKEGNAKVFHRY